MKLTDTHSRTLAKAFEKILGSPEAGTMAFVRCLTPDIGRKLAQDSSFAVGGWEIRRVADSDNEETRTVTADRAVEIREMKADATLLLVDTELAGAGMDGIYSAAREVDEKNLFGEALKVAGREVTRQLSSSQRKYAENAIRKAQARGRYFSLSPWVKFDFLCHVASNLQHPGTLLHLIGLWPVATEAGAARPADEELNESRMLVGRLLETPVAGLTPAGRIETIRLLHPSDEQKRDLEHFLRSASTKPLLSAMEELSGQQHLWINNLRMEQTAKHIQDIELLPWRTGNGKIAKWSGLTQAGDPEAPPELVLDPDAEHTSEYSWLEVRWKTQPAGLGKNAAEYRVLIKTGMDDELASREVSHSARQQEKCRFSNDDFSTLNDDALIPAKVVVSVIGETTIEERESEEFIIRFGKPEKGEQGGVGKKFRTFSEGLIEIEDRETVSEIASSTTHLSTDSKGFVSLRTLHLGKGRSFQVFQPPLVKDIEEQWREKSGAIGRWKVRVHASGMPASKPEFERFPECELRSQAATASRKLSERFYARGGGICQVYDEKSKSFDTAIEYLRAWSSLLERGEPKMGLANTVEVQSLSGRTIGLIVLPSHPLRVAWLAAYDNLVLHTAFVQGKRPKDVRDELSSLDGEMFPAFLPGLTEGSSFVFADMLGFHAVGMVPDNNKEPKAAVAMLARALGGKDMADATPTVGEQSSVVLGNEILKYLDCHDSSRLLHVHALRSGDGLTVARALGFVHKNLGNPADEEDEDRPAAPSFVLELYPSKEQVSITGRFIVEAREKRRSGAGVVSADDYWMLESLNLPGGISLPRLRWARKETQTPDTASHLALAFDTFESSVEAEDEAPEHMSGPLHAFGLLSFFDKSYEGAPVPLWRNTVASSTEGEKHPSGRAHTERLARLQDAVQKLVAKNIDPGKTLPVLKTEISREKTESLEKLHAKCDWVVTLDRNAGVEYFDSPRDNKKIYDSYVIDCVPERDDLGCLQLITSTGNMDEVRNLLDGALKQMQLSRSLRNAEFLFGHLKALSGRLAIRFTGQKAPTSELIALAFCHANCRRFPSVSENCWVSLEKGFFIPVDDILDIMPRALAEESDENGTASRADLIYVSVARKSLEFRFIEVKYRKHLRTARTPRTLETIRRQTESLRKRWHKWYDHENICQSFRAVRRAKLARVLRFYADKAHRHFLPEEQYRAIWAEIDRMVRTGGDYSFAEPSNGDRGWVFCPEYAGISPLEISPEEWNTRVFLFGPALMPDSDFHAQQEAPSNENTSGSEKRITDITHGRLAEAAENGNEDRKSDEDKPLSIALGKDSFTGTEVSWPLTVRGNPHLLAAGLPGMGKTTCLLNLCKQMLAGDIRPIVFSYHEDLDEKLAATVPTVRFIDFEGLGFNPLQVTDRKSRMAYLDIAGALRDIFSAIFPELGDVQGEHIRKAVKDSFIEAGWDAADISQAEEPEFKRFVEILRSAPKPDRGLRTLLARLDELEDYGFFELRESRESIWESDSPTVIRVHKTQNDNLQKAFASLVFYGLYKDMFRRGVQDRITHAVIFDEAHRAAGMNLIPTMAKECRKFGISLVLASQEARDFNSSVFSAIANYLVLRLTETDAKILIRNVSSSQQERTLVDKVKQMEKFKALFFREGRNRPFEVNLQS